MMEEIRSASRTGLALRSSPVDIRRWCSHLFFVWATRYFSQLTLFHLSFHSPVSTGMPMHHQHDLIVSVILVTAR
jgi:hypothetical protein